MRTSDNGWFRVDIYTCIGLDNQFAIQTSSKVLGHAPPFHKPFLAARTLDNTTLKHGDTINGARRAHKYMFRCATSAICKAIITATALGRGGTLQNHPFFT
jgi:hypothetical protein